MYKKLILTTALCGLTSTALAEDSSSNFNNNSIANLNQQQTLLPIQPDQLDSSVTINATLNYLPANDMADTNKHPHQLEQEINQLYLTDQKYNSVQS
ncbi:hypothetical protein, partial [Pseudoalteromonas denitrificans]